MRGNAEQGGDRFARRQQVGGRRGQADAARRVAEREQVALDVDGQVAVAGGKAAGDKAALPPEVQADLVLRRVAHLFDGVARRRVERERVQHAAVGGAPELAVDRRAERGAQHRDAVTAVQMAADIAAGQRQRPRRADDPAPAGLCQRRHAIHRALGDGLNRRVAARVPHVAQHLCAVERQRHVWLDASSTLRMRV